MLVTLTLLVTGLSIFPRWKRWSGFQMLLFNGTSFLIKIQIAIIYLLSGVDKLYSSAWRSGEAIQYMMSLDYLFNPSLTGVFPTISWLSYSVGWLVILFEILFPVLVWTTRFRIWILGAGVLFHMAIIVVLSLIDFGLIMIVTYLIFLKDEDFKKLRWCKELTPRPIF